MSAGRHDSEPQTRRERLTVIAEEYTEVIHDPGVQRELGGAPVPRYAAVISEGPPESRNASDGKLITAENTSELAEKLARWLGEGRLAHGRAWDLDIPFDVWGNLEVAYSVCVGEGCGRPVHAVRVDGRHQGLYLFDDRLDAEAFVKALHRHGRQAELSEEPVHDHRGADRLIDAEREP